MNCMTVTCRLKLYTAACGTVVVVGDLRLAGISKKFGYLCSVSQKLCYACCSLLKKT